MLWLGRTDLQVTWEPASSLPVEAIHEFESKIASEAEEQYSSHYGYSSSTILVTDKVDASHPTKKSKIERPVAQDDTG